LSSVIVAGNVSGSVTLDAPAVSGSTVITLPTVSGTMLTNKSPGTVLQVISTQVVARSFSTSSTSYVDITGLSATITPTSATSKIMITGIVSCGLSVSGEILNLAISRNGTVVGSGNEGNIVSTNASADRAYAFPIQYLDSPASTSALTYTFQTKIIGGSYTFYLNRRGSTDLYNGTSVITLMEIAA
jgi:hypothetical protein